MPTWGRQHPRPPPPGAASDCGSLRLPPGPLFSPLGQWRGGLPPESHGLFEVGRSLPTRTWLRCRGIASPLDLRRLHFRRRPRVGPVGPRDRIGFSEPQLAGEQMTAGDGTVRAACHRSAAPPPPAALVWLSLGPVAMRPPMSQPDSGTRAAPCHMAAAGRWPSRRCRQGRGREHGGEVAPPRGSFGVAPPRPAALRVFRDVTRCPQGHYEVEAISNDAVWLLLCPVKVTLGSSL